MALIVEDGSGIANANTYADLDFIRAYATARGVSLSDDDAVLEPVVMNVMDFIESRSFNGTRIYIDGLSFPRAGIAIDGVSIPANVIPSQLMRAEAQLVIDVAITGVELLPSGNSEPIVKREKVGPLETEFFAPDAIGAADTPLASALLAPFIRGQGAFTFKTVRV
ncbi:hypothetical protein [Sphingomonas phage Birtae]|nr:hypothetical protein [Sphingomonas phage Birtae]